MRLDKKEKEKEKGKGKERRGKERKGKINGKRIKLYKIKMTFGTLHQNMKYRNLGTILKFEIQYDREGQAYFQLVEETCHSLNLGVAEGSTQFPTVGLSTLGLLTFRAGKWLQHWKTLPEE